MSLIKRSEPGKDGENGNGLRPMLVECFPRYADKGEGVCGIPIEEFSEEKGGGVGPGMEYWRVREGVDTGEETYGEKVRCGCGLVYLLSVKDTRSEIPGLYMR